MTLCRIFHQNLLNIILIEQFFLIRGPRWFSFIDCLECFKAKSNKNPIVNIVTNTSSQTSPKHLIFIIWYVNIWSVILKKKIVLHAGDFFFFPVSFPNLDLDSLICNFTMSFSFLFVKQQTLVINYCNREYFILPFLRLPSIFPLSINCSLEWLRSQGICNKYSSFLLFIVFINSPSFWSILFKISTFAMRWIRYILSIWM